MTAKSHRESHSFYTVPPLSLVEQIVSGNAVTETG